jgi:nucleolar protein 15
MEKLPSAKAKESRKRAADFFDDPNEKLAAKEVDEAPVKTKKAKTASIKDTTAAAAPTTKTKKAGEAKVAPTKVKNDAKEALVKSKKVVAVAAVEHETKEVPAKSKEVKKAPRAAEVVSVPTSISAPKPSRETNGEKTSKKKNTKAVVKASEVEEMTIVDSSSEGEDNIADQTAALLAGFDSSSDEDEDDAVPLDQVPKANISKKARKALEAAKNDTPGTIYVG